MKRSIIAATALLIPAALFAEVQINFNVSTTGPLNSANCNDIDEWFEDAGNNGSANLSFEYQWSSINGRRTLQYRQVSFFPVTGAWAFGAWMAKDNYCHPSCDMHHEHHFYHRAAYAPQWRREYSREDHRPHYYYDKRYKEPVREYHEYNPPIRHQRPGRSFERVVEKHYYKQDNRNSNYQTNNDKQTRSHQELNNHWQQQDQQHQNNYQTQRDHSDDRQPIVRITERERIIR